MRSILLALLPLALASAQQAIVNVPSADITPKGKVLLLHETQVRTWHPDPYWYGTNFFTYGVGKNTELAVTNWNLGTPAAENLAMGVGFKSSIPLAGEGAHGWGEREPRLIVGQMTVFPLREAGVGTMAYALMSARFGPKHTRISAGALGGTHHLLKHNTVAFAGAIEQPVSRKLAIVTEWFSGENEFGFLIPGIVFTPTAKDVFVVGYKIPNVAANGPQGFIIEYGRFF
jgi:hypothetical protein